MKSPTLTQKQPHAIIHTAIHTYTLKNTHTHTDDGHSVVVVVRILCVPRAVSLAQNSTRHGVHAKPCRVVARIRFPDNYPAAASCRRIGRRIIICNRAVWRCAAAAAVAAAASRSATRVVSNARRFSRKCSQRGGGEVGALGRAWAPYRSRPISSVAPHCRMHTTQAYTIY